MSNILCLFLLICVFRLSFIPFSFTDIPRSHTGSTAPALRARMVGLASIASPGNTSSSAVDLSNTSDATEKNCRRSDATPKCHDQRKKYQHSWSSERIRLTANTREPFPFVRSSWLLLFWNQDVDKVRRRIRDCVNKGDLEATRQLYNQWITLLDELIIPPHQENRKFDKAWPIGCILR